MNAHRRRGLANLAALSGAYALFLIASAYMHGWWYAGVIAAWLVFSAGETALWLWAGDAAHMREEQARPDSDTAERRTVRVGERFDLAPGATADVVADWGDGLGERPVFTLNGGPSGMKGARIG